MERLTKRGAVTQKDINELLEYSNENQFGPNDAYYKLKRYEDLEEEGRLIELPCAVGTTYYMFTALFDPEGRCEDCPNNIDDGWGGSWCCEDWDRMGHPPAECLTIKEEYLGSVESIVSIIPFMYYTIFPTREEAEKRLEKLKSN